MFIVRTPISIATKIDESSWFARMRAMKPTPVKTNTKYGRWLVTPQTRVRPGASKSIQHWCRCECGAERWVNASDLAAGRSTNCGCVRKRTVGRLFRKHGLSHTREYVAWCGMLARCSNPKHKYYHRYGGRGIKVCKRWRSFVSFLKDMGAPPSPRHKLDRIDNNGDYKPSNCRWVTNKENCNNSRHNHRLQFQGLDLTITQWAERTGVGRANIHNRLKLGWSVERALTTAVRGRVGTAPAPSSSH